MQRVAVETEDVASDLFGLSIDNHELGERRRLADLDDGDSMRGRDFIRSCRGIAPEPTVALNDELLFAVSFPYALHRRQFLFRGGGLRPRSKRVQDSLCPAADFGVAIGRCRLPQGVDRRLADGVQLLARFLALRESVMTELLDQALDARGRRFIGGITAEDARRARDRQNRRSNPDPNESHCFPLEFSFSSSNEASMR